MQLVFNPAMFNRYGYEYHDMVKIPQYLSETVTVAHIKFQANMVTWLAKFPIMSSFCGILNIMMF